MAKQLNKTKEGFTIIEVVLVLAIAGLIFLMVFVALPALQRSQRDTQRRNDMSRVDTSLTQYQTNHSNLTNNLPEGPSKWVGATSFTTTSGSSTTSACSGNAKVACEFVRDYMNTGSSQNDGKANNFQDPDGVPYSMVITCNWGESGCTPSGNIEAGSGGSQLQAATAKDGTSGYTIANYNNKQAFDAHAVYIIPGGRCIGDVVAKSSTRHFAIIYRLEGAGNYCIDDQ